MKDKIYHLCVELTIDGKKQIVTIAKGNLLALEKYTSFCSGPMELLRTMPDRDDFSSKKFLDIYLSHTIHKEDSFSIRTSGARGSKKLPLLYKKDEDILLMNKEEIVQNIRAKHKFTIEDLENGNVDEKTKDFFRNLWNLFYDQKILSDIFEYMDKKLNPDKFISFDKRYEVVLSNRWMILGLSRTVLEKFIQLIFKDPRKRIECMMYLKENHKELLPTIDFSEKQKRIKVLEKEITKKRTNVSEIRRQIDKNLCNLSDSITSNVPDNINVPGIVIEIKPYEVTEEEIINYNEKRGNLSLVMQRILTLSKELENLRRELLITKSMDIKEKIENRISEVEFEIYELENNKYSYTDSGILIKEDEMKK